MHTNYKGFAITLIFLLGLASLACSSRKEGTCERDSHCDGLTVCFEKKCLSMKEVKAIRTQREEDAKPKICKDNDGDGVKAGNGCKKGAPIDCDDKNDKMAPGKVEICDDFDNNCDGLVNEGLAKCSQALFTGKTGGKQGEYKLNSPHSVIVDDDGSLLVTDSHHLWRVSKDGQVQLVAGSHLPNFADGQGEAVRFSHPHGIIKDRNGDVLLADCKNNCVRRVTREGHVSHVAGMCSSKTKDTGQFADGGKDQARFYCPTDLALDVDGSIVVLDQGNARIRRIGLDGQVSTIAGVGPVHVEDGEGQMGYLDGPANEARFNDPQSVLVDSKGIIYVSESFNCRIRRIDPKKGEHGEVSTLAGESDTLLGVGGHKDGRGAKAKFNFPHGMAFDAKGNLLVVDTGNAVIRRVTPRGRVSTVVGRPDKPKAKEGSWKDVQFGMPIDVAPGPDGSLYVLDAGVNRLRKIVP
ncbi:MAG: hypothetical protein JRF33_07625 [Deltaproteobacteria bacterium]|nr:hypothetical protein [Deltaproteobacteria bacterium]